MSNGYVYGVVNPYFPDLIKVGLTKQPIEKRLRSLSSSGTPGRYELRFVFPVRSVHAAERLAHKALSDYRESSSKEFFRIDHSNASRAIKRALTESFLIIDESEVFEDHVPDAEKARILGVQRRYFGQHLRTFSLDVPEAIVSLETSLYTSGFFDKHHQLIYGLTPISPKEKPFVSGSSSLPYRLVWATKEYFDAGRESDRL